MLKSIQIMFAIAAHLDYEIWQIDVKTAFLNRELEEEVYMIQLEDFISTDEFKVCKLQKSIYGLKQASRSWNIYSIKWSEYMVLLRTKKNLAYIDRLMVPW